MRGEAKNAATTVGTRFIASNDLSTGIVQTHDGWLIWETFLLWNTHPLCAMFRVSRERDRKETEKSKNWYIGR
jgi:hypothetical protein